MDRRAIIAGANSGVTPLDLRPFAWFSTLYGDVTQAGGTASVWYDRSPNKFVITQAAGPLQPTWEPNGWAPGIPSLLFSSGGINLGTDHTGPSRGIITQFQGGDIACSVLLTCQPTTITDMDIVVWQEATGTAIAAFGINNLGGFGPTQFKHEASSGTTKIPSGSNAVTTAPRRMGYSFGGSAISSWVTQNGTTTADMVAASANVGICLYDQFVIGDASLATAFRGRVTDVVICTRAITFAEYQTYLNFSLPTYGA